MSLHMRTFGAGLLSLALLIGLCGRSTGLTGIKGMRGTFRVVSGDAEGRGNLALGLLADHWRKTSDTTEQEVTNLTVSLATVPRPSLELYALLGARSSRDVAGTGRISGVCDSELGLKIVRLSDSWFKPGLNLSFSLPTGRDEFSTGRAGLGVLVVATFDFKNFESFLPLRFNINGGYTTGSDGQSVPIGASLELPSRFFTPVIELTTEQGFGDTLGFRQSPLRFTQGVKATPLRWLGINFGYDINLADETVRGVKSDLYNWRLFGGIAVARSLKGLGPQPGSVYGTVKDGETGEPLPATVSVKGGDQSSRTESGTGAYRLEGLGAGLVSLIVEAEGSKRRMVPAVVMEGRSVERNIELATARKMSRVDVRVTDTKSGGPVDALLRFEGEETAETRAGETGTLVGFELPAGDYEVECTAPGYLRDVQKLSVGADRTEELEFTLLRFGEGLVVAGVDFAENTANLKVESDAGIREVVRILDSNPGVRFEIGGHTDNRGSEAASRELSLKRASVFERFLVKGYNIPEERLLAKGYGGESPIADNSTEEGRRENRRIEVRALGKGE
jgi:outer membrane protein OmpA-like peptidoglycan-associated protein